MPDIPSIEAPAAEKISPGAILLQARLRAGLSQEQLAKQLYMTVYKVNALETDDYKYLSSDTFARGYIRAYASLVGVDIGVVLAAYDDFVAQLSPVEDVQPKVQVATETSYRGAWQFLLLIGIFFIALWLISVWFFDNHSDEQYVVSAVAPSSAANSGASVSAGVGANISAAASADKSDSVRAVQERETPVNISESSAVAASSAATVVEPPAKKITLDELRFSFRAESWLEVSDSRGDVLATELQVAGSTLNLVGLAPFDVKLGNAPAVDIALNGKKIDVIPLMGSNVLTLKIDN